MGFVETLKEALTAPSPKGRPTDGSTGAYWCDDCGVRIRDVDLEDELDINLEGEDALEGDPRCPDCGDEMRFERASGRDCAC